MSKLVPTYIEQALRIEVLERAVIASEGDVERLERELAEATVKNFLTAQRPWAGENK